MGNHITEREIKDQMKRLLAILRKEGPLSRQALGRRAGFPTRRTRLTVERLQETGAVHVHRLGTGKRATYMICLPDQEPRRAPRGKSPTVKGNLRYDNKEASDENAVTITPEMLSKALSVYEQGHWVAMDKLAKLTGLTHLEALTCIITLRTQGKIINFHDEFRITTPTEALRRAA